MPERDQKNMEKGGKRVKRGKFEKAKSMFSLPTQLNFKKTNILQCVHQTSILLTVPPKLCRAVRI